MKIFVDIDQYLLTASYLLAPVLLFYAVFFGLAKLLSRLTGDQFRLPFYGHIGCAMAACALAPFVALFLVDRPAELHESSGRFIVTAAIAAFIVVGFTHEMVRKTQRKGPNA